MDDQENAKKHLTLGSLFDGSGGFPLAGTMCGIEPVWASEVEPYPIAVTRSRFPQMKHYGDVSQINGAEVPPVDILTFGSPCQGLSVAGLRKGVFGDQRSNLFFQAIRIAKEMRDATDGRYPTYLVWENVAGCQSSGHPKGADFQAVLAELVSIVEKDATPVEIPKGGWNHAGCLAGNGWSLAWRLFDLQFWGCPQRRSRIYLVLDTHSERAGEILFEREGVSRDSEPGFAPWKRFTRNSETGSDGTGGATVTCANPYDSQSERVYVGDGSWHTLNANENGGQSRDAVLTFAQNQRNEVRNLNDKAGALAAEPGIHQQTYVMQGSMIGRKDKNGPQGDGVNENVSFTLNTIDRHAVCFENHQQDTRFKGPINVCPTVNAQYGTGGNNTPLVATPFCKSSRPKSADDVTTWKDGTVANTLNCFDSGSDVRSNELIVEEKTGGHCYAIGNGQADQTNLHDICGALNCMHDQQAVIQPFGISAYESNAMKSSNPHSGIYEADTARTLDLNGGNPACNQGGIAVVETSVYDASIQHDCKSFGEVCETIQAAYGTGGNNTQIVVSNAEEKPCTLKIRSGCEGGAKER